MIFNLELLLSDIILIIVKSVNFQQNYLKRNEYYNSSKYSINSA